MKLSGLHILLTYQCNLECDHCFTWGSPRQTGTLTLAQISYFLQQAKEAGVEWIYLEGGEPFLYYPILVKSVDAAVRQGFHVGVVTNGYWASTVEGALEWLKPLTGLADLSVSSDLYHYEEVMSLQAKNVLEAARQLRIPVGTISVAQPEAVNSTPSRGQIAAEVPAAVMCRGRAATQLAARMKAAAWEQFTTCPHEDLREPGRVHLDPLGNLHLCQGIVIGNVFTTSLKEICGGYNAEAHPICGLLLSGGPVALVSKFNLSHKGKYADACHLCYQARLTLRSRFPEILKPDQMYGVGL